MAEQAGAAQKTARAGAPRRRPAESVVQSLSRGLGLLEVVARAGSTGIGLTAASEALALNTSTAHHLLSSLLAHGYVEQHPETGRYRLGAAPLALAHQFMDGLDVVELARPFLAALHAQFDEWTFLSVLREGRSHAVFSIQSGQPLVVNAKIGNSNDLHCTSSGKVLLAGMDAAQVEAYLGTGPLQQHTAHTITDPDTLRRQLAQVRAAGYATQREEDHEGLVGIAAPIRDAAGRVLAACGLGVPLFRATPEREAAMILAIRQCAARASQRLGYVENTANTGNTGDTADG